MDGGLLMSLNTTPQTVTAETYAEIFERERANVYPTIDAQEDALYLSEVVDRARLEAAARVLCCPFKAQPPNWQHGRVIYAVARSYLRLYASGRQMLETQENPVRVDPTVTLLDIGTAKGFSALCLLWATEGLDLDCKVTSVDVLPPTARVRRNTPAEVDGLKTLYETLEPFPEAKQITFVENTGIGYLKTHVGRIHVAFVDGKHTDDAVYHEGGLLADRQVTGDVVIFDDWQVPGVSAAIKRLKPFYDYEVVECKPGRAYAIARRT